MQNAPYLNCLYRLQYKHRLSAPDLEAAIKSDMVHLCDGEINEMRLYLREVRNEIEDYFAEMVDPMQPDKIPADDLRVWLMDNYPWMDGDVHDIAYKDGLNYAVT